MAAKILAAYIKDAGVADAYIKGKKYKIRLCKVGGARVNVEMALNLANMLRKAQEDGVDLKAGSSFRTMEDQIATAKANDCYVNNVYKRSACTVATATPGYSNHQSGTAIDFKCGKKTICYSKNKNKAKSEWCAKNGSTQRPDEFPCFKWMVENANNYGYYNYPAEAWHWSATGG